MHKVDAYVKESTKTRWFTFLPDAIKVSLQLKVFFDVFRLIQYVVTPMEQQRGHQIGPRGCLGRFC